MSISGALNLTQTVPFESSSGDNRTRRTDPASPVVAVRDSSTGGEPAGQNALPAEPENSPESGRNSAGIPPQSLVDPANLSLAQETAEEPVAASEDESPENISARLIPIADEDSTETVALDGRPEAVKAGELVSESQRLTGEPLAVPDYNIDPIERDIQVFNDRISRATQVLEFLNSRPAPRSSGAGVSIVV
ncbi:hypothetical protein [Nisaea sp.]|uniref:hypothetical protein n=1 Tax=Nisaea sp. TaxID=2024842 RepID=UPI0032F019A8